MAKLKEEGAEPEVEEKEPKAEPRVEEEEFSLEPEAKEEDDDDDGPAEPAEPRKPRKERRAERGKLHEALASTQKEATELRERLARMEGYLTSQASHTRAAAGPEKDPLEAEIEELERQGAMVLDTYNAKVAAKSITPEELTTLRARAAEVQRKQRSAEIRLALKQHGPKPPDPRQEQARSHQAAVYAMYPDVASKPEAFGYAQALWNARRLLPGAKQGNELLAEVMDDAREKFGLVRQQARPSQNTREQFSGTPKGAAAASGGLPKSYKPSAEDWRMADAAFGYITDKKKRMQHFITKVIKPQLEEEARQR